MKKIFRTILIILLFLPLIAVAHFIVFPQETRCMLIEYSDFKKQENIFYRKDVPATSIQQLIKIKKEAEKKVAIFWKDSEHINYKLIYCEAAEDYKNYGREGAPAVVNIKMGAYVVIPKDMLDVNILSHEISHTVLYRKIGWYKYRFKIPTWFDEGFAMQVDMRDYYSTDALSRKNSGIILPDVTQMNTPEKFRKGSNDQVILNYLNAK